MEMKRTFGKKLRFTTYGESHGSEIECKIEGFPSGLETSLDYIRAEMRRRRPGQNYLTTQRREEDEVEILSGVKNRKTDGSLIHLKILNKDVDQRPYNELKFLPIPWHGDLTKAQKYGWKAVDIGGGRETALWVAAGAFAKQLLELYNVEILAHTLKIAGVQSRISYYQENLDLDRIGHYLEEREKNLVRCLDGEMAEKMEKVIQEAKGDSVGGRIEVIAKYPAHWRLGEPLSNGLDAVLSKSFQSIPGVGGVDIGFEGLDELKGSEAYKGYKIKDGKIIAIKNFCGGIEAGISNGMPIVCLIKVKPTTSIAIPRKTVYLQKEEEKTIKIKGRHDSCIVPRAVSVVEAMMALTLADYSLIAKYIPKKLV